jgi:hypothetical protein
MPARKKRPYLCPVVPDRLDLRDRVYQPAVDTAPAPRLLSVERIPLRVLHQGETNACTGFALASVVGFLRRRLDARDTTPVSPFMLYSMARRYDEFPGRTADEGSSLRGAMKGWYKHGACSAALWAAYEMPKPNPDPAKDWWQDAATRPLGAYYRVDTRSVTDMHVALREVGILYASAVCHGGWDGLASRRNIPRIPVQSARANDGGHAFAIVGYDETGFVVLNSWGRTWGWRGLGILTYEDWLENAMDCWVAQVGVVTEQHREVARATSLRASSGGAVALAGDPVLRNRELSPFIVDMENNGRLSASGDFRTNEDDLRALLTHHLDTARARWGLGQNRPVDVAIYAHGGLTGEDVAATTAARWIPALYEARIFPIFLMWETDLWSTIRNRLEDVLTRRRPTGGLGEMVSSWWDTRIERTVARPGSALWSEMKQNAEAISRNADSGARVLYRINQEVQALVSGRTRLHLIGHSAGAIVHSHLVHALAAEGWEFETVNFLAPAVTMEAFGWLVVPHLGRAVKRYNQFHLTDTAEQKDPTCRPILGYGRSLLYLVSGAFEDERQKPILGMEKFFRPRHGTEAFAAPSDRSACTTHGGFDDDALTMRSLIDLIKARPTAGARTRRRRSSSGARRTTSARGMGA